MATFADYDAHGEEGGDDNSSVTICPDVDGDAVVESHSSPRHVSHNGIQTNASTTIAIIKNSSETTQKLVCKSKTSPPPHHNGSEAAKQHHNSNNEDPDLDDVDGATALGEDMGEEARESGEEIRRCGSTRCDVNNVGLNASATNLDFSETALHQQQLPEHRQPEALPNNISDTTITNTTTTSISTAIGTSPSNAKNLLLCRRFKDSGDTLRNFTSLPLFIYATSPSTHATSADGVGVAQVAVKAAEEAAAAANKKKVGFVKVVASLLNENHPSQKINELHSYPEEI